MTEWRDRLEQIRRAQTEIMRTRPYKDFGLVPNPGAAESAIATAEARIGVRLPKSYREFLAVHDGWPRFYEGATLLGTANLGRREYEDVVQAVFRSAETPVPDVGPPSSRRVVRRPLIPFGVDLQGTTMFAFDRNQASANGELAVTAWVSELGLTFPTFDDFLTNVLDWLTLDTSDVPLRASA
jgi:hypothetical protein